MVLLYIYSVYLYIKKSVYFITKFQMSTTPAFKSAIHDDWTTDDSDHIDQTLSNKLQGPMLLLLLLFCSFFNVSLFCTANIVNYKTPKHILMVYIIIVLLYENIDQILPNRLHGPMQHKIGGTCIYNGHVFYTLL